MLLSSDVHFENNQEYAHAAHGGEPEGVKADEDDYKKHMPEFDIGDNGMPRSRRRRRRPKSPTTASPSRSPPHVAQLTGDGGARAQAGELAHVGALWSYTSEVWRSEPNEHHEAYASGEAFLRFFVN